MTKTHQTRKLRRSEKSRVKARRRALGMEQLEDRIVLAVVGYYDMSLGQGNASQVQAIVDAGHTPLQLFDLSPAELAGIEVLDAQNPNNGGFGGSLSRLTDIENAVDNGMVLVIHDRFVDNAESILPAGAGFNIVRDFADAANVDVLDDTTLVTNGPGGIVDDTTLDGGNSSTHGFAFANSLPGDATLLLSTGDPTHVVTFAYPHGSGAVIYSSIPLDFYRASGGNNFSDIYAPNVLAFAADKPVNKDLIAVDDLVATPIDTPIDISVLANDSDPQGGLFWISDLGAPSNGAISETNGVVTYTPNVGYTGPDSFTYEITDDQGDIDDATVRIDVVPEIVFVDDDQGETFERFFIDALDANGRGHKVFDVEADGVPSADYLKAFKVVIWNTGYDFDAPDAGLSPEEQASLAGFLDNGGGAFIVGQDILYNGVTESFQKDYLKVESFTGEIRGLAGLAGAEGNEIGDGLNLPFQLPPDFPEDWSDVLAPTADAAGVFYRNIANGNAEPFSAVSYPGLDFRVVFMAAPFEGISESDDHPNNQKEVMERIVTFLFAGTNRSPIATDNSYVTQLNTQLTTGNVLLDPVADSDPDGDPLTVNQVPVTLPTNGALSLAIDGTFIYTPDFGFHGVDTFEYSIDDSNGGTDTATVTILVGEANRAPVTVDDDVSTLEDTSVSGNVLDNDSDPDGDTLFIDTTPVVDAQYGTVTLLADGSFTYAPDANYNGPDSFVYLANDGFGLSTTGTVYVTVWPVNDAPTVVTPNDLEIFEDAPQQTVILTGIGAGGGESQTLTVTASSDNVALVPDPAVNYTSPNGTGSLVFTPAPASTGEAIITVTITDDGGTVDGGVDTYTTTFKVIVSPPPSDWLYFSRKDVGDIGGVSYDEQDIIAFDGIQFRKYFDGTPWLENMVIDAFAIADNEDIYLSLVNSGVVEGVTFDDSDILRFDNAAQTWSMYFDGSDVGLSQNGEDIDGLSITESGDLLISTNGSARVAGLQTSDEDIIKFTPNSLGESTSGSWSMFFDGSDVFLSDASSEDVDGFSVTADGDIYFSTIGSFNAGALFGRDEDVGLFRPTTVGDNTTGNYQSPLAFDGSLSGFTQDIGALHVDNSAGIGLAPPEPFFDAPLADFAAPAAGLSEPVGEGEAYRSQGNGSVIAAQPDSSGEFFAAAFAPEAGSSSSYFANANDHSEQDDDSLLELLIAGRDGLGTLDQLFADWDRDQS